jgi:hypothetical protein
MTRKEAINTVRNIYQTDKEKEALEILIPELKESEDERIRKDLITFICQFAPKHLKVKYVAYLEKQKEQKPESCDCSRDEESYTNGIHHVLMNPEAYGLIKQQPAEQLGGTFTSYDMAKTFTEGQNYVIAHPEKFGLYKPAEWSEEEKMHLYNAIEAVKYVYDTSEGTNGFKCVEFLKSLRAYWKPSEEQMKWLKDVIETVPMTCRQQVPLESLYADLKKLL